MIEYRENFWCELCGKRIRQDDEYYDIDDHIICPDHVKEYLDDYCKEISEDGEEVYIVNDFEWETDDLKVLLSSTHRRKDCADEEEDNLEDEPEYRRE